MSGLLAAASNVLGVRLTDAVGLDSSERSVVLRCRRTAGGTVVVKSYPGTGEGVEGFTAEAAGLRFTTGAGIGPDLLAIDPQQRLIVMTDLGDAPSLADLLLGAAAEEAETALFEWTTACGELAVRTAGREHEFAALVRDCRESAGLSTPAAHWLPRRTWQIPDLLARLSIAQPPGLGADLAEVAGLARPGWHGVFSPGDICPDNNLLTADGFRFIDFESAEYHSVFLDAAYLRMPFSSCWCVFTLPARIADAAERRYRGLVASIYPDLGSDRVWMPGLARAVTAWTLHAMTYLLDRSMVADGSMNQRAAEAPTARQLLRYRWRELAVLLDRADELPAIAALMRQLLASTRSWQVDPLPLYPAFR